MGSDDKLCIVAIYLYKLNLLLLFEPIITNCIVGVGLGQVHIPVQLP